MLLDEIIVLLSDQNGSLEAALLKTKVLLHQIGHKDLVPWVNNELGGYPDDAELPSYRYARSEVHGSLLAGFTQYPDTLLAIGHLNTEQIERLVKTKIGHSIGSLEENIRVYREKGTELMRRLPPEAYGNFRRPLTKGTEILAAWCTINMADLEGIVVQVRSRLLDFCLELQDIVGIEAERQQLEKKAATVDTGKMFHTTIYGGTVILGSQNVQVNNQKGDIDDLLKEIGKLGFEQEQLADLRRAVIDDIAKGTKPEVTDGETGKWFVRALKKAGKGVVKASVDVVSSVIVKALERFTEGG